MSNSNNNFKKTFYHPINTLNTWTKAQLVKNLKEKVPELELIKRILGTKTAYTGKNSTMNSRKIYYDKASKMPTLENKISLLNNVQTKA